MRPRAGPPGFSYDGAYRTATAFVAGTAVGALTYYGGVALLWVALALWIERKGRSALGETIGKVLDWL